MKISADNTAPTILVSHRQYVALLGALSQFSLHTAMFATPTEVEFAGVTFRHPVSNAASHVAALRRKRDALLASAEGLQHQVEGLELAMKVLSE